MCGRQQENRALNAPLSNQRHELFAHALASGETCDRAYQLAGFKPNRGNASALRAKQHIQKRVAEIQANMATRVAEKVAIDKAYVLARAVKMHEETAGFQEYAASARFLEMVGRHKDIQAFKDASDVNVTITVDTAIARLQAPVEAIEGDYEVIE